MKIHTFFNLLLALTFLSCKHEKRLEKIVIEKDPVPIVEIQKKSNSFDLKKMLNDLFIKSIDSDSIVFYNEFDSKNNQSFLYFKSGKFLNTSDKNAIVITCSIDTLYSIKLYDFENNKWIATDSITGIEAYPWQFDLNFNDYNFDGFNDLYIQVTASMGYSISRGHLIIVNPKTKKLELHQESRYWGNMTPDYKTHTINSEIWNGYSKKEEHQLTVLTHKWVNGKLKTVKKQTKLLIKKDYT